MPHACSCSQETHCLPFLEAMERDIAAMKARLKTRKIGEPDGRACLCDARALCGPIAWEVLHSWASNIEREICPHCGEFAVKLATFAHDVVNAKLGKPLHDPELFEEMCGHVHQLAASQGYPPGSVIEQIAGSIASMSQPAPFGWPGGKKNLKNRIIPMIPPHNTYVEPFAGAAHVFWAKEPAEVEVLNDTDPDLMRFYRNIGDVESCDTTKVARNWRRLQKKRGNLEPCEFLAAVQCSFGNGMFSRGKAMSHTACTSGQPVLHENLEEYQRRLQQTKLENRDWENVVRKYDSPDTFFYLDPPYHGTDNHYYGGEAPSQLPRLAQVLPTLKGKWILSMDDHPEVRAAFKGSIIRSVSTKYSINADSNTQVGKELLISNFKPRKSAKMSQAPRMSERETEREGMGELFPVSQSVLPPRRLRARQSSFGTAVVQGLASGLGFGAAGLVINRWVAPSVFPQQAENLSEISPETERQHGDQHEQDPDRWGSRCRDEETGQWIISNECPPPDSPPTRTVTRPVMAEPFVVEFGGGQFSFAQDTLREMDKTARTTTNREKGFRLCQNGDGVIVPGQRCTGGRCSIAIRNCRGIGPDVGFFHTHPTDDRIMQESLSVGDLDGNRKGSLACVSGKDTGKIICGVAQRDVAVASGRRSYAYVHPEAPASHKQWIRGGGRRLLKPEYGRAYEFFQVNKSDIPPLGAAQAPGGRGAEAGAVPAKAEAQEVGTAPSCPGGKVCRP